MNRVNHYRGAGMSDGPQAGADLEVVVLRASSCIVTKDFLAE